MHEEKERIFLKVADYKNPVPAEKGPVKNNLKTAAEIKKEEGPNGRIIGPDRVTIRIPEKESEKFFKLYPMNDPIYEGLICDFVLGDAGPIFMITGRKTNEKSSKGEKMLLNVPGAEIHGEILTGNQVIAVNLTKGDDPHVPNNISDADWNNLAPLPEIFKIKRRNPDAMSESERRSFFLKYDNKGNTKYQHHKMGQLIIEKYGNIICYNKHLYYFDGKRYTGGETLEHEIDSLISYWYIESSRTQREETIAWLKSRCYIDESKLSYKTDPYTMTFANGRVNVMTGEISDFDPEIIDFAYIPTNYNPDAKSEKLDKFIDDIMPDKKMQDFFWEYCGTIFSRGQNKWEKCLVFYGPRGGNGKSTLLGMMQHSLCDGTGNSSVSDLSSTDLVTKFSSQLLDQKIANFSFDDHFCLDKKEATIFKRCVDGESYTVQEKNQNVFRMKPFATLFFATNERIDSKDLTGGFTDRFQIIKLMKKFRNQKNENKDLKEELKTKEVSEAFIAKSIQGLMRLTANKNRFTQYEDDDIAKNLILTNNSSVSLWAEEIRLDDTTAHIKSRDNLYKEFCAWCDESGIKTAPTRSAFTESMIKHFDFYSKKSINNEYHFIYDDDIKYKKIEAGINEACRKYHITDDAIQDSEVSEILGFVTDVTKNKILFSKKDFLTVMKKLGWTTGGHNHNLFKKIGG